MGTIFEELIRRFNEENNEEAGEHFTPRDVVELMSRLRRGRNYDSSFQYSKLRLTNREWFREEDQMGSHIPIRQLRRSSVNARPRGVTPFGVLSFLSYSQTLVSPPPPLCRFSVSKRSPRCSSTIVGLRPLSRDISSGFSDSLFFPSALFNSPVASGRPVSTFGKVSGTYSLEAGPGGSGHQLTAAHRTAEAAVRGIVAGAAPKSLPGRCLSSSGGGDLRKACQKARDSPRQQEIRATRQGGG